ncbi:MAG TPA: MBL fold metallo-hydrolase [bacterium]|jgi:Cft2 family RNA processing exonuclease|nr:MBL fold metallo-hydrolase [bacterium]HOX84972.1 MBL fold metallo-hydrolase [bacterium]HPG44162.1 MBL fold metallo-hydrolase [bacterium]HPM96529.1 MBL fold metallo-hydrolase [bacterium]
MFDYHSAGIKIRPYDFWLDATRAVEFSFISHGHTDHLRNHQKVLATPATLRFFALRGKQRQTIALPFGQTLEWNELQIELFPAGHILGSAMIRIEHGGRSLLYTGDFKLRPSLTAEHIKIPQADILIMESTFGRPEYRIKSSWLQLVNELKEFIDDTFRRGQTPVVLAYSLGKGQEAMKILGDLGYPTRVHSSIWQMAEVYREFGAQFDRCALWHEVALPPGEVLLFPPHICNSPVFRKVARPRTVFLSGWANRASGFRFRADHMIALSDHADFDELQSLVKTVNPQQIYTTHGFDDFPHYLQELGFSAQSLDAEGKI